MSGFSPQDIEAFEKVRINGEVNGDEYLEEDFYDLNKAWNLLNKPLYDALRFSKVEGNSMYEDTFGNMGGRGDLVREIQDCIQAWDDNKDAEVLFYFEDGDGDKYEFEAVLRNDRTLTDTEKPFSFIELKHVPGKNRSTAEEGFDSVQRLALRNAFEYTDEYLEETKVGSSHDFIYEADLITAFDREGGLWDQFEKSEIPFSQMIRSDFGFIRTDQEINFEGISRSAPYIGRYVTDELEDAGISYQDAKETGKHIGTANALGLSFRQERELEELKLDFDPRFGESLIIIDPEFAEHITSGPKIEEDFNLFNQQVLPSENWREIDKTMREVRENIVDRADNSSKDWKQALPEQMLENWEKDIPENRILQTEY